MNTKPDYSPSEWLDLLMKCQNGETTCMRVMQIIEDQTVSKAWLQEQYEKMLALCHEIEKMPASLEQTNLSLRASNIAQEMQRVINYVYMKVDYDTK